MRNEPMDNETSAAGPKRVSARSRRMAMTAAFLGGIVVAGVGVAFAQQDGTSTTTVPPAAKEAPALSGAKAVPPGGKVKPDGRGAGPLGKLGRGPLDGLAKFGFGPLGALHGEFVAPDGNGGVETYWFGYQALPDWAPSTPPRAYPFTEARLTWMIGQVITRYAVDPDHVSCLGGSMGAWGATSFCLRHAELFSAVYPDRPRPRQFGLPSLTAMPDAAHAVMADGTTPYLDRMDSVKYVSEHHEDLPFFVWDIGRNDGYGGAWQNQIDLVNAFEATHHGFAFMWNDGDHSGTGDIAAEIQAMYPPEKLARNESYPAFSHSSIDDNLGNGDPTNGDPTGGINLGFDWTAVDDESHRWSASISNTATVPMTVDVTPRRCQKLHLSPGDTVSWTTSTGGSGTLVADAWGLVTVPKVSIAPGKPTVVTVLH